MLIRTTSGVCSMRIKGSIFPMHRITLRRASGAFGRRRTSRAGSRKTFVASSPRPNRTSKPSRPDDVGETGRRNSQRDAGDRHPGHTPGHFSLELDGEDGLIITADAVSHGVISFKYPRGITASISTQALRSVPAKLCSTEHQGIRQSSSSIIFPIRASDTRKQCRGL